METPNRTISLDKGVTLAFVKAGLTTSQIALFGRARRHPGRSVARGLCSRIYRIEGQDSEGNRKPFCLKRVCQDEERPPHSIQREIQVYAEIDQVRQANTAPQDGLDEGHRFIATPWAAFYDESDAFSIEIDVILPWWPATLEEARSAPSFTTSSSASKADARKGMNDLHRIVNSTAFILSCSQQLFAALAFLHSHGIAHRDVKPSNLMLALTDAKHANVVLIDLGTAFLSGDRYAPGDDGKGHMTSEVGTGAYRAPETLFAPRHGYDPYAVDVWQAAVTLSELLLPPPLPPPSIHYNDDDRITTTPDADLRSIDQGSPSLDDRLPWERVLWSQGEDESAWTDLRENADAIEGHSSAFLQSQPLENRGASVDPKQRQPRTLFDGHRGDLGLADAIFNLLGLPSADAEGQLRWPEAVDFQPSLARMPFKRRPPAPGGLKGLLHPEVERRTDTRLLHLLEVLCGSLRLSASQRLTAASAHALLTSNAL